MGHQTFATDFLGCILGACLVSAPVFALVTVSAREALHASRVGVTTAQRFGVIGHVESGAPKALSHAGDQRPHTGGNPVAMAGTSGFASDHRSLALAVSAGHMQDGRSQGVRSVPSPSKPYLREMAGAGLRKMATDAANLCGVPVRLFHALIERESSWRPFVVSRSGAVGLAQVKPSTARGVSTGLDVWDPWQNLVAGACYLRAQYDRFGSWPAALHAYRVGPNAKPSRVARRYAADIIQGSAQ